MTDNDDDAIAIARGPLALRRPDVPVNLSELAALREESALQIIDARAGALRTVRLYALRETHPSDWTAYRRPDGVITCYLDDDGCARVRDLFGISIYNVSRPEKVDGRDGSFMYFVTGDGKCSLTGQVIEQIEGGRSSAEKFCEGKDGAELERVVRKAARANLNGTITRELGGLESIPIEAIALAWDGSAKHIDAIARGRGFGSQAERHGGNPERGAPNVPPPVCSVCGTPGRYIPAKDGRAAFYGCPNYTKHKDRKWTQDADRWVAQQPAAAAPPPDAPAAAAPAAPAAPVEPPAVGDIKW